MRTQNEHMSEHREYMRIQGDIKLQLKILTVSIVYFVYYILFCEEGVREEIVVIGERGEMCNMR